MKTKGTQSGDLRDAFPLIRFSYDKKIVGSNLTALPLLGDWNCRQGAKIPTAILQAYPELEFAMKDASPTECKVTFGELQIWFDLVPFPEAGYIGMYGYHIESMIPDVKRENLRMAG